MPDSRIDSGAVGPSPPSLRALAELPVETRSQPAEPGCLSRPSSPLIGPRLLFLGFRTWAPPYRGGFSMNGRTKRRSPSGVAFAEVLAEPANKCRPSQTFLGYSVWPGVVATRTTDATTCGVPGEAVPSPRTALGRSCSLTNDTADLTSRHRNI